jgi:cyanophycin synthetase
LAFVKALIVEAVKDCGFAVLNADDAMTASILPRVRVKNIFFTRDLEKAARKYEKQAHCFVYAEDGLIKVKCGVETTCLLRINDIPLTANGTIACNIENCLAAVAALWALNIPTEAISSGLSSFADNPGRFNCHAFDTFTVMVDYGHNPAGYEAAIQFLKASGARRLIGVIGVPGDRLNADIEAVGRLCAGAFSKVYIKEDIDLRGRAPGEVAALLRQAVLASGIDQRNAAIIENELDALKVAVAEVEPGDMIAVFYEELEPLEEYLHQLKTQPPTSIFHTAPQQSFQAAPS